LKDERIVLGIVRFNLSEYVDESDNLTRSNSSRRGSLAENRSGRRRSSTIGNYRDPVTPNWTGTGRSSPSSNSTTEPTTNWDVDEGVVRRYLLQDSKINSTLKIGILMVQIEGERTFIAPPLRTAPVFGGITGIMAEQGEQDDAGRECCILLKCVGNRG
jgi:hypothetical protein